MDDEFLLVGDPVPLHEARFYFHEVTPKMMRSPGFSQWIKREFTQALNDDWYIDKHIAFAAFDDCHFVLLTSHSEFSPYDFSDYELMQILALCEEDMKVCIGSPCVIDLDRLHKHCLKLA